MANYLEPKEEEQESEVLPPAESQPIRNPTRWGKLGNMLRAAVLGTLALNTVEGNKTGLNVGVQNALRTMHAGKTASSAVKATSASPSKTSG